MDKARFLRKYQRVVTMLQRGRSYKSVAHELCLSQATVAKVSRISGIAMRERRGKFAVDNFRPNVNNN